MPKPKGCRVGHELVNSNKPNKPWFFPVAQMVKNMTAMQETRVRSLDWKGPLENEMTTHSSILAWKIPWTEGADRLHFMGLQTVRHTKNSNREMKKLSNFALFFKEQISQNNGWSQDQSGSP